jgi:hypothetical protein
MHALKLYFWRGYNAFYYCCAALFWIMVLNLLCDFLWTKVTHWYHMYKYVEYAQCQSYQPLSKAETEECSVLSSSSTSGRE